MSRRPQVAGYNQIEGEQGKARKANGAGQGALVEARLLASLCGRR